MTSKRWTPDEDALLRSQAPEGVAVVARLLGRSQVSVNCRASRLSISLGRCNVAARVSSADGFMRRVEFDTNGGCWLWSCHVTQAGYGATKLGGKHALAHRLSYEVHIGPIPDGMFVCHKCDVRACVNPDHLFVGTHQANTDDMVSKGRHGYGERNPNAKITADQASAIRRLLQSGMKPDAASRVVGVSKSAARNIAYNNAWAHLDSPPKRPLQSRPFSPTRKEVR